MLSNDGEQLGGVDYGDNSKIGEGLSEVVMFELRRHWEAEESSFKNPGDNDFRLREQQVQRP